MKITTINQAIEAFQYHWNGTIEGNANDNLHDYFSCLKSDCIDFSIDLVWSNICDIFEFVNSFFRRTSSIENVDYKIAVAISCLQAMCLDNAINSANGEIFRRVALRLSWRISAAWEAVLAGDIDNINEHVILEEISRI